MNDIFNKLKKDSIKKLQVCYVDYNGRLCGKYIPEHKFNSVFKDGIVFAKANYITVTRGSVAPLDTSSRFRCCQFFFLTPFPPADARPLLTLLSPQRMISVKYRNQ